MASKPKVSPRRQGCTCTCMLSCCRFHAQMLLLLPMALLPRLQPLLRWSAPLSAHSSPPSTSLQSSPVQSSPGHLLQPTPPHPNPVQSNRIHFTSTPHPLPIPSAHPLTSASLQMRRTSPRSGCTAVTRRRYACSILRQANPQPARNLFVIWASTHKTTPTTIVLHAPGTNTPSASILLCTHLCTHVHRSVHMHVHMHIHNVCVCVCVCHVLCTKPVRSAHLVAKPCRLRGWATTTECTHSSPPCGSWWLMDS
jgi:hypothetical protein